MRVIGYLRVSSDEQARTGFGLEAQRTQIAEWCERRGHEVVEWISDEGVSGAKEDRPGFNRIIYGEISNPPIEAIVVAATDRVARDITIYYYFKYQLRKKDVALISVKEDFGEAGALAPVLEALMTSWAQIERERIAKRTLGGKEAKKRSGGAYIGGRAPYGYNVELKRLVVNDAEALVVRKIFDLYGRGYSLRNIASALTEEGIITRRGNAEWSFNTVQGILDNEKLYRGYVCANGRRSEGEREWVKGEHEAIL